jgi:5-methyltetrahydrofolate--homocysteine methyltransferase
VTAGDVGGAWAILEAAYRAGHAPVDLYVELLGPVLRQVGDEWEAKQRSVESEHRVTAVATRLIGRIEARGYRAGRRRRATVVVGGAPGDPHQLPITMVADVLRWDGFNVVDLGANVPEESFLEAVGQAQDLVAVGVSLSVDRHARAVSRVVQRLRRDGPGALLLVGGPAIAGEAEARKLGADGWAPHAGAVADLITAAR